MPTDLPEELKEKLKIIEKETKFFSQKPQVPNVSPISFLLDFFVLTFVSYTAIKMENRFLFPFYIVIFGYNITNYFIQKRIFNMYSTACEIINYYKKDKS